MSIAISKQLSGLRFKLLSALVAAFLVLFVGQFSAARIIFLNSYIKLAQERAIRDIKQVKNTLDRELSQINISAGNWAQWDDTARFVRDGNAAYIASNLVNESFTDLDLNVIAIANSSGQIIFGSAFDLQSQKREEIPSQLTALISQKQSPLLRRSQKDKSLQGLVIVNNKPMLLVARAILTSNNKEPIRGTLFMGRFLNRTKIEELAKVTQVPFQFYLNNTSELPDDVKSARSQLSLDKPIAVRTFSSNTIVSYILIADIFGRPMGIARSQIDPNIYLQLKNTYVYYFWTTLIIGLIVCALSWILLEKLILLRLGQFARDVSQIGATGNLSARVILPGRDELSSLANILNSTLEKLQQSQLALCESQDRYAVAVAGANDGLWDWNLLSNQIYFSPRWKAILGCQENEIDNCLEAWFDRVAPQDIEALKWGLEMHLKDQTPHFQYEYQMRHQDGTYRWVLCRGLAVRNEQGKPYRMAGSLNDITERRLAEADLAKRTLELERSNQELEQFAYIASHDLQEPLRKIQAFSDRLKTRCTQLNERDRDYLERIHKSAKRMQTLIQDLLLFSRITTKAEPFVSVDLKTIILDVVDDLEVRIGQVRGRVEVGELFAIEADPPQIRQLFQNLLSNALKFYRPDEPPVVKIAGEILENGQCQISVIDNGIGFEQKYSDRIFQVFQRLHGRHEYEGTGIGLAICAKIVARHHGAIAGYSKPGQGATFLVTLPVKQ